MFLLFLAYSFLTSYQFIAVLLDNYNTEFFGYTIIFLSANCVVVIVIIFLNSGIEGSAMRDFMIAKLGHGQPRDPKR
jgi:hypothetical protein